MKNLLRVAFFALLVVASTPSQSKDILNTSSTAPLSESEANKITSRLAEIESMDKSNLSRPEKKELRREVKALKKTADSGGGVYISVGALILIIILLIILL